MDADAAEHDLVLDLNARQLVSPPDRPELFPQYFRVERTCEGESDGWLRGKFLRNEIGCTLNGHWAMRRIPLGDLTSFYQIEQLVVRPLGEKFASLSVACEEQVTSRVAGYPYANGHGPGGGVGGARP
jgi:hypothetical protein